MDKFYSKLQEDQTFSNIWPRVASCPCCGQSRCKVAPDQGAGWCYRKGGLWVKAAQHSDSTNHQTPITSSSNALPPEILNKVYRDILASFPLSREHHQALRQRGLSEEAIERGRYGSLTVYGRLDVAKRLIFRYGSGIPGFYLRSEECWSLTTPPGLLIPVRNLSDQIHALLVRLDCPGSGKYQWFTSSGRPGGVSSGAPCHLALPLDPAVPPSQLWITEGPLKADVMAYLANTWAIGLPGVAWRKALEMIVSLTPDEIILAFDADKAIRPEVKQAEMDMAQVLISQGYNVRIATWELKQAKGIDDLLVQGKRSILAPFIPASGSCESLSKPLFSRVKELPCSVPDSKRRRQ